MLVICYCRYFILLSSPIDSGSSDVILSDSYDYKQMTIRRYAIEGMQLGKRESSGAIYGPDDSEATTQPGRSWYLQKLEGPRFDCTL
jgi:hypothetical protein